MGKTERKIADWILGHLQPAFAIAITICSIVIRISFRDFVTGDMLGALLPWWDIIHDAGGFLGLKEQVGNYNLLYQLVIACMTYLPIEPMYQYKLLSAVFDYLLAGMTGYVVYDLTNKNGNNGVMAYTAVIMSPLVFLNSAAWGQCDSIYTFFVISSLLLMKKEHYEGSFILLGVAFAFKLQTIFILPFYVLYYFQTRKISIWQFFLIPLTMCVTAIPNLYMGRGILDVFGVYAEQVEIYSQRMVWNYPSFWCVFNDGLGAETLILPAAILTMTIIGSYLYIWLKNNIDLGEGRSVLCAFILVFTCVLFLPKMHERYGYVYEILAIIIAFMDRRTILPCVALNVITMVSYSAYLYGAEYNSRMLAAMNLAVYAIYLLLLMPGLLRCSSEDSHRKAD